MSDFPDLILAVFLHHDKRLDGRNSCSAMDIEAEKQYLLDQIEQDADPEHQKVVSRVIPSGLKTYGLLMPVLREIARSWQRAHQEVAHEELFLVAEALWDGESREERMMALELLQRYPHSIPDLSWAHFERWRRDLDNWELTDVLGMAILGPWVLADPQTRVDHLRDLIADEDLWSRRLALVSTVGLNRGRKEIGFPVLTLELIDRVKEERHPMITKALSWTLRVMGKKYPDEVTAYLEENRDTLAPHVVLEVSNKLKTGVKSGKSKKSRSVATD